MDVCVCGSVFEFMRAVLYSDGHEGIERHSARYSLHIAQTDWRTHSGGLEIIFRVSPPLA